MLGDGTLPYLPCTSPPQSCPHTLPDRRDPRTPKGPDSALPVPPPRSRRFYLLDVSRIYILLSLLQMPLIHSPATHCPLRPLTDLPPCIHSHKSCLLSQLRPPRPDSVSLRKTLQWLLSPAGQYSTCQFSMVAPAQCQCRLLSYLSPLRTAAQETTCGSLHLQDSPSFVPLHLSRPSLRHRRPALAMGCGKRAPAFKSQLLYQIPELPEPQFPHE